MGNKTRTERGQSIILLAVGLAGLLAFAALAVDGGMAYFDRRGAQNAADSAALAGALAKSYGQNWRASALNRAASNGYDNNGRTNTVEVYSPPISGPYAGDDDAVQVIIHSTVSTSFVQFAFNEPLRNTVEAVSRIRQAQNIASGYGLYGASPYECKTIWFMGTQATNVTGGGIYSNSASTSRNCPSGAQGGSGDVTVIGGSIELAGSWEQSGGSGSVSPAPIPNVPQQDLPDLPIPDCSDLPDWGSKTINKPTTLLPGRYSRISITGDPTVLVQMMPGMYCIYGSQGFTTSGAGKLIGLEVLIYMEDGPFDVGGGFRVNLTPPTYLLDASGHQWANMLLYVAPTNMNRVGIRGTSNSTYAGTIYARSADCELAGTGDTLVVSSQVICDTIKLSGTAAIFANYDPTLNYMLPPAISLFQ